MFSNASIHPTDPRAFLVYIMLDEKFQVVPEFSGALQAENPDVLGQLAVTNLRINTNGFLYVYVNNASIRPVFFDNLFINHTSSHLLDKSDYYPFGMLWSLPSQTGDLENNYKYNGKELQKDLALYTEDYGARQYDPVIGRWLQVDPLAEKDRRFSPFNYGLGNPVRMIDPDGRTWFDQVMGVAAAVIDNASLGLVNFRDDYPATDAADYNHGQDLGDIASVVVGADEAATGGGMSTAAVVAIPESGGLSALAVPAGAGMVWHGRGMLASGVYNFAAQKGRVSEGNKEVNGNSKSSTKDQHNYDVKDTYNGKIVKTGTSSSKETKTGESYRGKSQANKWNKQEGTPGRYKSEITNRVPSGQGARKEALDYEKTRANEVREQLDPEKHKRP